MSLKTPSRGERPLSLERLESRQMMSGTALTAMQQETVQAAGMVLRDDPVTLLSGEKEFNGSTVEVIADSPVFTDGSFMIEVSVRPNVIRGQTFVSKYDSQSAQDQGFYLGMYPDGRLQFSVYGNGGDYRLLNTTEAPLVVGKWQKIRASFDIQSQKMSITVDGREIPATIPAAASKEIRTIHDGSSPVRVGASVFGGGLQDFLSSGVKDVTFYPGEFGAKQEAAAVDAVIAEEEAIPETVTAEKQITAESIDAVLRAAPVTLLSGTKEFNGSTVEVIADSPVFTDGSFTIEATVKPDVIKSQTIVSKYDSRVGDKSFFLGMLGDGRLQFIVYGDNGVYRMYETPTAPLTVGTWQQIRASFDIDSQKMTIMIDGKEIPMTLVEGSQEVKTLHDGTSPVQVAASSFGGGPTNYWDGWIEDPTFYPVDRYGIPQQAVTVGAVIAEEEAVLPLTEAEALTAEQELTAEMVQTVLTNLLQTEAAPQTLTDTPDLGGATLQNGVLQIALPGLGGTASMMSWQGHAQGNEVKTITGAEGRQAAIAAGVIVEEQEIDTTPTLADVLALPEGIQRNQNGTLCAVTKSTQELGKVTVSVGDARRYTHLVSQNGMIGGEGSGWTFGQAGLSLTFVDGPRYVQWIDLKRLSGYTSVKVHIWNAQGAVRTVWASESGRLEINDTVSIMATYPEQQSSSWVIQAINTDPIVPPPAFEETWMQASGELVGLDLSDTDQAVQSVDMNVHSNQSANTIQAIACRGEERIATQAVAEDGTVHFESLEGITSVLFVQSDPTATLYVTSMSVSGLEGSVAPASTALSPMSNADVAKCGARQWEHGNFNPADVAVRSGVQMNRGGYENRVNGRMLFQSGIPVNSQTQYTRYTLTATSGSVGIAGLWYADSDGLHRVPQEYWELVAGNSVIIAPGAPKYIVIDVGGNGTFDVAMNTADHATDIVPSQEMQLRSSVVIVRKTGPAEGFCTVPPGVSSENAHATAGGTVNMFYQILNDGLGSGPITVKIHVGQTGSIADPVQKEFTGEIRGLTSIGLSADVTLTADNDIATMEVVGANGASTTVGQQVRPAHGSEGTGLSILQQAEHLARAGRQVAEALRGNNPTARLVVAAQGQANIQRERQEALADGTTETVITVTENELEDAAKGVLVAMAENKIDAFFGAMSATEQKAFFSGVQQAISQKISMGIIGSAEIASLGTAQATIDNLFFGEIRKALLAHNIYNGMASVIDLAYCLNTWLAADPTSYMQCINDMKNLEVQRARERYGVSNNEELNLLHQSLGKSLLYTKGPENMTPNDLVDFNTNIKDSIFLHQQGSPEQAGKLVIFFLGNAQDLGDDQAGLYTNARRIAVAKGYEVLVFRSGHLVNELSSDTLNLYPALRLHPEVVFQNTRNIIEDRMQKRGMFAKMPEVREVSATGYSWGGGTADRLFGDEASVREILGDAKLKAVSYIDAVRLSLETGHGMSVDRRPACEYFYNAYQQNALSWTVMPPVTIGGLPMVVFYPNIFKGEPVHGTHIEGANYSRDWGFSQNHLTIDETETQDSSKFNGVPNALTVLDRFSPITFSA